MPETNETMTEKREKNKIVGNLTRNQNILKLFQSKISKSFNHFPGNPVLSIFSFMCLDESNS